MHLRDHALSNPDRPACIMSDGGKSVSFSELDSSSNRCA